MKNVKFLPNAEFLPFVISLVEKEKSVIIPLRGNSMLPYLVDGRDKAILVKIENPLRVGDVVLAELTPGHFVLHRIISIRGSKVQLMGDGNLLPDPVIDASQVKVIASAFIRKGRGKEEAESVHSLRFRIYSAIWMKLRPLRRVLLAILRRSPL